MRLENPFKADIKKLLILLVLTVVAYIVVSGANLMAERLVISSCESGVLCAQNQGVFTLVALDGLFDDIRLVLRLFFYFIVVLIIVRSIQNVRKR